MAGQTYKAAGVDLEAAQDLKSRIKSIVAPTHGPRVLGGIGPFAAMYRLPKYREPVLVSSTDGVGTKLKLAAAMDRYDSLGEDLVNACVNDVITAKAEPLFFLDYVSLGEMDAGVTEGLIKGMARACKQVDCALIGGETAQMPGVYAEGDFDLAGFVVGVVEKDDIPDPSTIRESDVLLGLPSNGLHTNGYSLARRILRLDDDPAPLFKHDPGLGETLGEALLVPHPSYYRAVKPAFKSVKAMAHITGGGLVENVPRILPPGLSARLDTSTWEVPPIFSFLQEEGGVAADEMFRVFNMGLGMVLVCESSRAAEVLSLAPGARVVGEVVEAVDERRVIL